MVSEMMKSLHGLYMGPGPRMCHRTFSKNGQEA